ncbi:HD domain-containing protein [Methanoculleus sp. FWC-SCC1]|uniref:HD domain-containing protein n=1 Tax=Methanoculleus frigidifontis TaxID=2584085 RepID=A0ABT8MC15_9EURY|nr:HD domain-containing protein [Methanoculleus sp. FWC-SCC1]MDN7025463.1 HD domain-containing protein [Methanoculleus sp. FWC-SCC1]
MIAKNNHEIRDPIYAFVHMDSGERQVLNSAPVQRLRHIHQLALTSSVYPGATHRRFEHSLGVMELATRIYNSVMENGSADILDIDGEYEKTYYQRVLRLAALVHDIGHAPFSHASEDLFPRNCDHELMTLRLIESEEMEKLWRKLKVQTEDVAKLALGPKHYTKDIFSNTEAILSEIITGDTFGADRMDYLLRDSHHTGVAYGRFDHYRLIETLTVLPKAYEDGSTEPALGVEGGGLQSAEALLLARYFMFSQLYFHPVRRIYDIHLKEFLRAWLDGGWFPTNVAEHLDLTDNEVMSAIWKASRDPGLPGHDAAQRIVMRNHYRVLYTRNPNDILKNREAGLAIYAAACAEFGEENVRHDRPKKSAGRVIFPVLELDERIVSSLSKSDTLQHVPEAAADTVYIRSTLLDAGRRWLNKYRESIIESALKLEDEL